MGITALETEELRMLVDDLVEEKLVSLYGDPDEGLEITDELKARLIRQRKEMEND